MESVNSLRISAQPWWPLRERRDGKCEGRNEKCEFLARESVSSSPIVRIFGKGKWKFIASLARQWWRHFRLSLSVCISLSLSLSLFHRKYLTHNIGSASVLPIMKKFSRGSSPGPPCVLWDATYNGSRKITAIMRSEQKLLKRPGHEADEWCEVKNDQRCSPAPASNRCYDCLIMHVDPLHSNCWTDCHRGRCFNRSGGLTSSFQYFVTEWLNLWTRKSFNICASFWFHQTAQSGFKSNRLGQTISSPSEMTFLPHFRGNLDEV